MNLWAGDQICGQNEEFIGISEFMGKAGEEY